RRNSAPAAVWAAAGALVSGCFLVAALVEDLAHLRFDAVLRQFAQEDLVDARILVLILDLVAALLDAGVDAAAEQLALALDEWIAHGAERDREVTGGDLVGIEVLVEDAFGRHEHHAVLPVDA